jgi:hypothetical protein
VLHRHTVFRYSSSVLKAPLLAAFAFLVFPNSGSRLLNQGRRNELIIHLGLGVPEIDLRSGRGVGMAAGQRSAPRLLPVSMHHPAAGTISMDFAEKFML